MSEDFDLAEFESSGAGAAAAAGEDMDPEDAQCARCVAQLQTVGAAQGACNCSCWRGVSLGVCHPQPPQPPSPQAWMNEKHSPELLPYEREAVTVVQQRVNEQVRWCSLAFAVGGLLLLALERQPGARAQEHYK